MRYFKKGRAPNCLTAAGSKKGAAFGDLETSCKNRLRTALGREQGWLCCYCMQRINDNWRTVKIEHRQSRSTSPSLQLEWKNLLAACPGGQDGPRSDQHCDTRKGDRSISLDPTNPNIETEVHYLADGRVKSDNVMLDIELNEVLGLNQPFLRRNRKAKLDGFIAEMTRRDRRSWSVRTLENEVHRYEQPVNGELPEYLGVIVWWIRKKIA